jgi:hypothetical protein
MRTSCAPLRVVARHRLGLAHRTEARSGTPAPRSCAVHVAPPSVVCRNTPPSPTAAPLLASENASARTGGALVATSVHELAPSTVRNRRPSLVAATPTASLRNTASTGRAVPLCAGVPGSGLRWANVSPSLSVRSTVPSVSTGSRCAR